GFFFQAEDGIRDKLVTGVQTCALPISLQLMPESTPRVQKALNWIALGEMEEKSEPDKAVEAFQKAAELNPKDPAPHVRIARILRSEERRVGKEWRSRRWP